MARTRVRQKPIDHGRELGDLYGAGTRVWDQAGKEFGLTLGWEPRGGGGVIRIAVYWPDGRVTWPARPGIVTRNGRWQIS